jgi:hypothetical protein
MEKVTGKRMSILVKCHDGMPDNAEHDGSVHADDTGCNGGMPDNNTKHDGGMCENNIECDGGMSLHKIKHNGGMPDNSNEDDNVKYGEEASAVWMKNCGFAVEPFYCSH